MINFDYTDKKGKETNRTVWVMSPASDKVLCIDLTEFDEDERKEYARILEELKTSYMESIREVGLGTNFRQFFKDKMTNEELIGM